MPITGVGLIGVISSFSFFDSLYRETLPPVTGVPKAIQASVIPWHEDDSCQYPIGFSGDEKFKLFVIAIGSAPTQLTFLADSATAAILPLKGSRETHLLLQSTEAATPENNWFLLFSLCDLNLIKAASDSPGLKTVFAWTCESYCLYIHRFEAIEGLERSFRIISEN